MLPAMLTRSAVAKRLRRSIATVRRLEGHDLFPKRDRKGVLLFDESEVAALARRLRTGDVPAARGDWLSEGGHARPWSPTRASKVPFARLEHGDELDKLRDENARLRAELAEMVAASAELLEQIEELWED